MGIASLTHLIYIGIYLCSSIKNDQNVRLIDVEEILERIERQNEIPDSLDRSILESALYLDYQLKERIDRIDSSYFKNIDLKKYSTADNDKFKVRLHKRYPSMEELIMRMDSEIYPFLQNTFGIEKEDILGDVIIFQNKAYLEFVDNSGHTTFIIDRRTKKATLTLIAYVID